MGRRGKKTASVGSSFVKHLEGGKFRLLNEQLYTSQSTDSVQLFRKEPELFDLYHRGYRDQVSKWPENPLDAIIARLNLLPEGREIADMGCGEARLAAELQKHKVHSFDLGDGGNKAITVCDISSVPLEAASVDAVVFCLSLMGTNAEDFVAEGSRVLKPGGLMLIAEVRSRIEGEEPSNEMRRPGPPGPRPKVGAAAGGGGKKRSKKGGASAKLRAFVQNVQEIGGGLALARLENSNPMFFVAELRKPGGKRRKRSKSRGKSRVEGGAVEGAGGSPGTKSAGATDAEATGSRQDSSDTPSSSSSSSSSAAAQPVSASAGAVEGNETKKQKKKRRRGKKKGQAAADSGAAAGGGGDTAAVEAAAAGSAAAAAGSSLPSGKGAAPAAEAGQTAKRKRRKRRRSEAAGAAGKAAPDTAARGPEAGSGSAEEKAGGREQEGNPTGAASPTKKRRLGLAPCIYKRR